MKDLSLYVHIPFCKSKCRYCDFISFPQKESFIDTYVEYMIKEIHMYSEIAKKSKVKTIFIGGGTPSAIDSKYIAKIMESIYKWYDVDEKAEISIESNPNSVSKEKLNVYKKSGINRISMGVQSLQDNLLGSIGRIHDSSDVFRAYSDAREAGFNNINFDLMFNLPNQTIEDVLDTAQKVIDLGIEHISLYSLKIEEGTPFCIDYEKGEITLPDEDVEREMYHKTIELLQKNNYKQYEISNFSKVGYECKHNLTYWKLKPYIGFGLGAHSNIDNERWNNVIGFEEYFKMIDNSNKPIQDMVDVSDDKKGEYCILGLRLNEGIDLIEYEELFEENLLNTHKKVINKFVEQDILKIEDNKLKFTNRGLDVTNQVLCEFI